MKILFLHLSDLHLSKAQDINETAIREIAASLSPQSIGTVSKIIVFVTGDIANSGKKAEYDIFKDFKRILISALKERVLGKTFIHIYFVPGNHDIDYSHISNPDDRQYYENYLKDSSQIDFNNEVAARNEFLLYSQQMHLLSQGEPLFHRNIIDIDGFSIEVNLVNTTFFSLLHENDQGLHFLPRTTIAKISAPSGAMMAITLLHHSHQWFNDGCKREIEKALLEKNTMIFCGHEHFSTTQEITYNGVAPARIFCGGCLCNCGDWTRSEFFACVYDTEKERFAQYRFNWDTGGNIYKKTLEEQGYLSHKYSIDGPKRHDADHIAILMEDQHRIDRSHHERKSNTSSISYKREHFSI